MAETMKALAKTGPVQGLELIDAPIPEAGPEDVLIRVHRTAVCGSSLEAIRIAQGEEGDALRTRLSANAHRYRAAKSCASLASPSMTGMIGCSPSSRVKPASAIAPR